MKKAILAALVAATAITSAATAAEIKFNNYTGAIVYFNNYTDSSTNGSYGSYERHHTFKGPAGSTLAVNPDVWGAGETLFTFPAEGVTHNINLNGSAGWATYHQFDTGASYAPIVQESNIDRRNRQQSANNGFF